jgi:hypothetical protein
MVGSQVYYLVRSKLDGKYVTARPHAGEDDPTTSPAYLLLFREHYDALSYLNTHGSDLAPQFAVESIAAGQVGSLLERWGFTGIAVVQDPLLPRVEFLTQ